MNIAIMPEGSVLVDHLVVKNNHTPLRTTNYTSDKSDTDEEGVFDYDSPPFNMSGCLYMDGNKYASCEAPSGLRGRLSLYDDMLQNTDAAIMIGRPPKHYKHIYDPLNEVILFGCWSCVNNDKLIIHLLNDLDIPVLILKYPTSQDDMIDIISQINDFLENLGKIDNKIINQDNLNVNLDLREDKISLNEFKKIINEKM
ncbi:MAG: methanogenesis marker 5 protein [Methanosphaera sp.]|nr:methanogenesis marker 5 protein [Methanosphaera sp.]